MAPISMTYQPLTHHVDNITLSNPPDPLMTQHPLNLTLYALYIMMRVAVAIQQEEPLVWKTCFILFQDFYSFLKLLSIEFLAETNQQYQYQYHERNTGFVEHGGVLLL